MIGKNGNGNIGRYASRGPEPVLVGAPEAISAVSQVWTATMAPRAPATAYSTTIVALSRLRLRHPIVVVIEESDGEVVASWPEIEAFGTGSTRANAVNSLKDEIEELYVDLEGTPDEKLGHLPLRWKRALHAVVEAPSRAR